MDAWNDLSPERPVGFSEGYIPRELIKRYGAEDLGLDGDDLEFFVQVIRRTDIGYLSGDAPTSSDSKVREVVSVNDAAGVKGLLSRLAAPRGTGDRFNKRLTRANARKRHRPDNNNPS